MSQLEGRSLGIALARGPDTTDARTAIDMAVAARRLGVGTELFLTHDGVGLLAHPELRRLREAGVRISACSRTVIRRGLPGDLEGIDYASQFQLGQSVGRCDRYVSFL